MFPPGGGDSSSQLPAPQHQHSSSQAVLTALPRDYQQHIIHQETASTGQEQEAAHGHFRQARASPGRAYQPHESHSPPVRDAASIKGVKYGSGHEKYPSWPTSAAAEAPAATRSPPTGGSHRSKSWTDHTQYPKENLVLYTRPYMKRHRHQQLKPVFEAADRAMPGPYKGHRESEESEMFEEESKRYEERDESYAERDYGLPSPPEREVPMLQNLDEYSSTYEVKMVMQQEIKTQYLKYQGGKEPKKLTQAELEEYTKNYEESLNVQHQKQSSYAQSEGYHSYVSSTDSTSTPFLDRLRREADAGSVSRSDSGLSSAVCGAGWDVTRGDRDSIVTTSSGSGSSSETLKWHGSLSDISVASSSLSLTSKQLIAHSSKVKTPQRHGSESVLYIARPADSEIEHRSVPPGNCQKHLKLFPVSTYAVPESTEQRQSSNNRVNTSYSPPQMTVAERVSELERQNKYAAYQDSKRQSRVGDPSLKAKQKSALLSFYERQQQKENKQSWRSEPQLASSQPPPPPQVRPQPSSRRASSASDYADWRDRDPSNPSPEANTDTESTSDSLHVPNTARYSPNSVLDGPVIVGPVICLDDWVPERPPKNAKLLRNVFPDLYYQDERIPSPDLPLPSPPTVIEDEIFNDEPFPPPPAEITEWKYDQDIPERLVSDKPNNLTQNPVVENVARPLPIRAFSPMKSQVSALNKSICQGATRDPGHPVTRPTELPLNSSNINLSHNQYKKSYCNFSEKTFRSSFRNPHDNSMHGGITQDIRASMRHYRSNLGMPGKALSPQKPTISAQKLLFRSTTVDETSTSPKRPINPFLRSTSLRQSEPSCKSMPPAPPLQKYPCDRIQHARYSCGPAAFNGNPSASDTPKETIGHYRPEYDKSKSVVSKIEQLQQILKGPVDRADTKKTESSGCFSASVVTTSCQHGATSKKMPNPGPPPLYPKQSVPGAASNRGNENVCYAPARAKLPDPSVGSYKLIQPKDEQPSSPKPPVRPALPDLLMPITESRPTYPSFEYITRRTCDKLLSLPLEYNKKGQLEAGLTPPPENGNIVYDDARREKPAAIEKLEDVEEEETKNADIVEASEVVRTDESTADKTVKTPEQEDVSPTDKDRNKVDNKVGEGAAVLAQPVIVEEVDVGEEDSEEMFELPNVTKWSETVPALEELAHARRQLLQALPKEHRLRHLPSISQEQRSPIDFIRDFFGEVPSSGGGEKQRPEIGAAMPAEASSAEIAQEEAKPSALDELKSDVMRCSARLVGALEAASEDITAAMSSNDKLGASVLQRLPAPLATKFTSHHTEVYHISSLMAGLSARLARTYDDTERHRPEGKQMEELRSKQDKLVEQLVEARSLKENIDARAGTLAGKISAELDTAAFRDYRLFMAVKPRLIIRARHLQYRLEYERDRYKALQLSLTDR